LYQNSAKQKESHCLSVRLAASPMYMTGQGRHEMQWTKPDIWQENAFMMTKDVGIAGNVIASATASV